MLEPVKRDSLQEIIRSLASNEKRYFKIQSKTFKDSSQLLRLFEVLDTDDQVSEIEQTKRSGTQNLSSARVKLRKLLLKSMRTFHEERNPRTILRNTLSEIDFLFQKQLYEEAEKEIKKGIKTAHQNQDVLSLYELLIKENELRKQYSGVDDLKQEFHERLQRSEHFSESLGNLALLKLTDTFWNLYIQHFDRDQHALNQAFFKEEILPNIQRTENPSNTELEIIHRNILVSGFNTLLGSKSLSEKLINDTVLIFERNPLLINNHFSMYFALTYNHSCGLFIHGQFQESLDFVTKVDTAFQSCSEHILSAQGIDAFTKYRYLILSGKLRALNRLKQFEQSLQLVAEFEELLKLKARIPFRNTQVLLYLRFGSAYFHSGRFREALSHINQGLLMKEVREIDILRTIYLMAEGLCFLMLKESELAQTKLTNLYKSIMRSPVKEDLEDSQIEFIRKIGFIDPSQSGSTEVQSLFQKLKTEPCSGLFLDFINPADWMEEVYIRKPNEQQTANRLNG